MLVKFLIQCPCSMVFFLPGYVYTFDLSYFVMRVFDFCLVCIIRHIVEGSITTSKFKVIVGSDRYVIERSVASSNSRVMLSSHRHTEVNILLLVIAQ